MCTSLLVCFVWSQGISHGDLDIRIKEATESIHKDSENEELYFNRGKLYYQHEEYQKGISDFQTALNKGYTDKLTYLYLSKCYFNLDDYENADTQVQLYFAIDSSHVVAHNHYGKILFEKHEFEKSANEFQYVIDNSIRTHPENYINTADSWSALGTEEGDQKAIAILENGLENQGRIPSLQNHLIKTLMEVNKYEQAIELQKSIIETKNRKEAAYYRLYEIIYASGDKEEAQKALLQAHEAWNSLPFRIKKNSAMIKLKQDIENKL